MRLSEVWIEEFKNLRDLRIKFDESPYTVLVGENGAGKSNLIEALTLIFRHLDLEADAPFSYELRYVCRKQTIEVKARGREPAHHWIVSDDGARQELTRRRFMADDENGRPLHRPAFVFGYYSGPSDRLAALYEKHRERYYTWIIKAPEQRAPSATSDPNALRRLFYAQTLHGQFALLAFFVGIADTVADDREFLRDHLQIDGLDSVLFALRRPPWTRKGGDARFWNAEGEVRTFLSRLYDASLVPIRMDRRMPVELTKTPSVENLYLFLPSQAALESVYQSYPDRYAFFTALESTYLSKLLAEVRTRVRMTPAGGGGEITYRDLSEGEQQLLLVLGLLKFTARDEALFLLDEPDTHLNPAWSTQYLSFLERFIGQREPEGNCHIVMSTHDPLVFAGLRREQVRIFRRDMNGRVVVDCPEHDPRGMGVAAILTSDLFRLKSTLDQATQQELDRQRTLAMKETLTETEQGELKALGTRLQGLGFAQTIRDPLYQLFVNAWTEQQDPSWRDAVELTPAQRADRARLAAEIVERLRREEAER